MQYRSNFFIVSVILYIYNILTLYLFNDDNGERDIAKHRSHVR